ncbi:hypothetical protein Rcae01_00679 [Novipirellula caenicola]|uniref:Uncharacterized protein n=1 Tax=Novipirellula caenicola TaxID=1536901 RepID=A0ABP9VND7_9BACT
MQNANHPDRDAPHRTISVAWGTPFPFGDSSNRSHAQDLPCAASRKSTFFRASPPTTISNLAFGNGKSLPTVYLILSRILSDALPVGKKMGGKKLQTESPSAVSHFPAPHIFLPNSVTDVTLGKTTPRLTRSLFPPRLSNAG